MISWPKEYRLVTSLFRNLFRFFFSLHLCFFQEREVHHCGDGRRGRRWLCTHGKAHSCYWLQWMARGEVPWMNCYKSSRSSQQKSLQLNHMRMVNMWGTHPGSAGLFWSDEAHQSYNLSSLCEFMMFSRTCQFGGPGRHEATFSDIRQMCWFLGHTKVITVA